MHTGGLITLVVDFILFCIVIAMFCILGTHRHIQNPHENIYNRNGIRIAALIILQ